MALENVIDEIISQAEKQKQEIIAQGKAEADRIVAEALKHTKQQMSVASGETEKMLDEKRKMELSSLNIRLRKALLDAKRKVLDELYAQLVERVSGMGAAERKEILHRLVEKAKQEIDARYAYCNEKDRELVKGLQAKGTINCIGGVIVTNADESVRVNYTFDVLLQNVREEHVNEIAKSIFG